MGQLAIDEVEVGAADGTGLDPDQHLARAGRRHRQLHGPQRPAGCIQQHGRGGVSLRDDHVAQGPQVADMEPAQPVDHLLPPGDDDQLGQVEKDRQGSDQWLDPIR